MKSPLEILESARDRVQQKLEGKFGPTTTVRGVSVQFPAKEKATLEPIEVAPPDRKQVLIGATCSLVSPGTERASYLDLPNTLGSFPRIPGYCFVGSVLMSGQGSGVQSGDMVVAWAPHASLAVVPDEKVMRLPEDVPAERAVFTTIGAIALQGFRKAHPEPGESVAVLGAGLIGQLTLRLAAIAGAYPIIAIARSKQRLEMALRSGADRAIATADEPEALERVNADVVIELTGVPEAIGDAIRAVKPGGRIVLVGSTRGVTEDPKLLEALYKKGAVLIGAHFATNPQSSTFPGYKWPMRGAEWGAVLNLIADGRLVVDDLITERVEPPEIPEMYKRLGKEGDRSIGVLIRWDKPGDWTPQFHRQSLATSIITKLQKQPEPVPIIPGLRSSTPPLRIAMVGCGEIALQNSKAIKAASNTSIVHAMDLDIRLAKRLASLYEAPYTTNFEEVLANKDVETVFLAVPHHLHAPMAIQAMKAGKHVIVEKPMANNVADCEKMIEVARETGSILSVCYCQRYSPALMRAKELIEKGAVGRILGTSITFGQVRNESYWTVGFTGRVKTDWRGSREKAGGGVLIMNLCHTLDYFRHLTGLDVKQVFAEYATLTHPVEVEDIVSATYQYEGGAIGTLCGSTHVVGARMDEERVWGSDGQIVLRPILKFCSQRAVDGYSANRWHEVKDLPPPREREIFVQRFAEAVRAGREPEVSGKDGLAVQRIIEAAYASQQNGQAIKVQES
ncbi:bi-domain-containing oxidoreductase [Argonema antarcticum]|uniref:bi-domain-containing oxidoreductase n=1 Tax=Argonema antarcticum TaxID=2942763 RepID=UPI002011390B|nr:bi-domain-containing oxidoreductase [Argonema antarcticum]MCL1474512.1 bi-domain-containing oxidoreductase [Argonema antarcticum A004/B2]